MSTTQERKAAFDGVVDKILAPIAEPVRKIMLPIIRRAQAEAWDECARAANDFIRLDDGIEETELIAANPYRETT